jgi:Flp pilus assembly protein TadG
MRRFLRNTEGSAMMLVGLGGMMLIAATGVAIDMGRVQVVQSRLSNALDAAGLAAGNGVNSGNPSTIVNNYFYANFPVGYMGATISQPTIVVSQDNSILTLDVSGTVPTTFMRIFNIDNVPVSAHSEITRSSMGLELVIVLDVTGSMSSSAGSGISKIQAAKNASTDLVNILYGSQTQIENLWVGLVPFAQAVNIGSSRGSWTSNPPSPYPSFGYGPTTWMGCVDARHLSNRDVTDDPPSVALFPKYYWDCNDSNDNSGNEINDWYGNNSNKDDCDTSGAFGYNTPLNTSHGPNKYCSQAVTPLSSNKNTVLNALTTLQPVGNTHIVLGAAWAWRMLSPRWRGLWGGEMDTNNLPLDYNTPLMNKAVILMTDGDNTITNYVRGAYGYLNQSYLGTTNQASAVTQLNNRTTQVCNSMKANGIIVYTIAFGTGVGTTAQNLLQNCATTPSHYFYSPTTTSLSAAFHQIGDSLANLRISQ